jgi:hypothetical protein
VSPPEEALALADKIDAQAQRFRALRARLVSPFMSVEPLDSCASLIAVLEMWAANLRSGRETLGSEAARLWAGAAQLAATLDRADASLAGYRN